MSSVDDIAKLAAVVHAAMKGRAISAEHEATLNAINLALGDIVHALENPPPDDGMEKVIAAIREIRPADVHVNVPPSTPADVQVTVQAPQVTVEAPQVNVAAPNVTVNAPPVKGWTINVTMRDGNGYIRSMSLVPEV